MRQQRGQLLVKRRIGRRLFIFGGQFVQGVGQGLRDVAASEGTKTTGGVGNVRAAGIRIRRVGCQAEKFYCLPSESSGQVKQAGSQGT